MKTKLLFLRSLLALLLVSTVVLADGRPTGLRISRAVSGGGANVEIDVTVPGTDYYYEPFATTVWLGNTIEAFGVPVFQYASPARNVPLPWAIDWGDGSQTDGARLVGPSSGPFTGTFVHTYATPGTYIVTVGDVLCCSPTTGQFKGIGKGQQPYSPGPTVTTGNAISGYPRYVVDFGPGTFVDYDSPVLLAVTATATVNTGTGIPTLNIYGLLALSLVLVGTGLLLYRKPQRTVA